MPFLESSTFSPSIFLRAPTIQTVFPSLARRPPDPGFRREILELPDSDFLELDWLGSGSRFLAIVNHGLEGSTASGYLRGMVMSLQRVGYDVLAWNMRGCGTERNRLRTWYHSGQSEDLKVVVEHALKKHEGPIVLVGFSIGGNILLKYLGEEGANVSSRIRAAVAISVPLDLAGSADQLASPGNAMYMSYLLKPLRNRIAEKAARFPGEFDTTGLEQIKTFHEFDARFTAPMHGFSSIHEYWDRCSALHFLSRITIPTLVVNALDDPFLSPACFPFEAAAASKSVFLETPKYGGHVGFITSLSLHTTWIEERTISFLRDNLAQKAATGFRAWA